MINFSLQFFFNCFFYTDKYISDVYHRNGVISFFSDLPKVIYSILLSFLVNTILKVLSYYKDYLINMLLNKMISIFIGKNQKRFLTIFIID